MVMQTAALTQPAPTPRTGGSSPLFGAFLILWIAFMAALVFDQSALDTVWRWLTGGPLVLQLIAWVLFLPITLGLWIWESDWSEWLRLTLIIMIAVGNLGAVSPKPQKGRRMQDRGWTPSTG
jgi:hypothetical protein